MPAARGNMLNPAELTRLVAQARQLPPAERQEFAAHLQQEPSAAFASGDRATAAQIMQMHRATPLPQTRLVTATPWHRYPHRDDG